jgi:hypothetical protein
MVESLNAPDTGNYVGPSCNAIARLRDPGVRLVAYGYKTQLSSTNIAEPLKAPDEENYVGPGYNARARLRDPGVRVVAHGYKNATLMLS